MRRRALLVAGVAVLSGCVRQPEIRPRIVDAVPDQSILTPLFEAGREFELTASGRVWASIREAGVLNLVSGRLIAADPSWLPSWEHLRVEPYTVLVPAGRYPVVLSVMNTEGVDLVAAAKLVIRDTEVKSWELAFRPGEDPVSLKPGEYFGVGVDVANAGFLDAVALSYMAEQEEKGGEDFRVLVTRVSAQRTDPSTGANYIVFNTGYGDGHYPVWIGRAAGGEVACFVMDNLICRLPRWRR